MRILIAFMMLLFSTSAFAGEQYLVKVEGMSCPFCAYGVEKKVKAMAGVASVVIDLKAATVDIKMKDGTSLPEAAVKKAIADAGFSFKSLEKVTDKPTDHKRPEGAEDGQH